MPRARPVRLYRRLLQSATAALRDRLHHPRTGRGKIRVTRCPLLWGKVNLTGVEKPRLQLVVEVRLIMVGRPRLHFLDEHRPSRQDRFGGLAGRWHLWISRADPEERR